MCRARGWRILDLCARAHNVGAVQQLSLLRELSFNREQFAARVARMCMDRPHKDCLKAGEDACRAWEKDNGEWPILLLLVEGHYDEELRARAAATRARRARSSGPQ